MQLQLKASLELQQGVVSMSLIPSVFLLGSISASISAFIIEIGLTAELKLMNILLIPTGTLISGPAGYQVCLNVDLQLSPLVQYTAVQGAELGARWCQMLTRCALFP